MTITEKRAAALQRFQDAGADANWQSIAIGLAAAMPRPAVPAGKAAPGFEWAEYSASQMKGGHAMFHGGCSAVFTFADGAVIEVPLIWRKNQKAPSWARGSRMAVHFYRAKMHSIDQHSVRNLQEQRQAVPQIIGAIDLSRDVRGDHNLATASTEALRLAAGAA